MSNQQWSNNVKIFKNIRVNNMLTLVGRLVSLVLSISIGGTILAENIFILIGRSSY